MQEWAKYLFRINFLSLQYKFSSEGRYAPAHFVHVKVVPDSKNIYQVALTTNWRQQGKILQLRTAETN